MRLGPGEIIVILFVLVVVFSASRMGRLGNAVGKFVYSFKRAARGEDLVDVTPRRAPRPRAHPEDAEVTEPKPPAARG